MTTTERALAELVELPGARRYTPDGLLFLVEDSPAHERYVELVERSDSSEELLAGVVLDCGEGSPTQESYATALTGTEPEKLRARLDELGQGAQCNAFTAPYRPAPRSMWSGGPQRVHLRRPVCRGHSRERRAPPPRRPGSRREAARAPPADGDPPSIRPGSARLEHVHGGRP